MVFCCRSRPGASQPMRTSALAARCTTASAPLKTSGSLAPSANRSSLATSSAGFGRASAKNTSAPVEKLSTTTTWWPAPSDASTTWEPMKPAPPVTTTFMTSPYGDAVGRRLRAQAAEPEAEARGDPPRRIAERPDLLAVVKATSLVAHRNLQRLVAAAHQLGHDLPIEVEPVGHELE